MKKPKVVFDLDGVIVDFSLGFAELLALDNPVGCNLQKTWQFEDSADYPNLTKKEVNEAWDTVRQVDDFWLDLPSALTVADENAMHRLSAQCDIVYVTDRHVGVDVVGQTIKWLVDAELPNPYHVLSRRVLGVKKWEVINALHPIAVIEDSPKNLPELCDLSSTIKVFRMERLYNDCCPGIPVKSVAAFCRQVDNLLH